MDLSAASLFASLLVGCVGMGLFLYGKKQARLPQLLVGIALMVFPYFVASALIVYAISAGLVVGLWAAVRAGW
jgi:hypothetical protein